MQIKIDDEFLDGLVVGALKSSYDLLVKVDPSDYETLAALKTVLRYYMIPSDFDKWGTNLD